MTVICDLCGKVSIQVSVPFAYRYYHKGSIGTSTYVCVARSNTIDTGFKMRRALGTLLVLVASVWSAAAGMPSVGIMYEGWHAPAVQAIEDCDGCARPALTIEAVLRSNGTLSLADAYARRNGSIAAGFQFHKEPLDGFYCMYRKRATDAHGATGRISMRAACL